MRVRIAINGLGRIGRLVTRLLLEERSPLWENLDLVAIHDFESPEMLVHALLYDSVHGKFRGPLHLEERTEGFVLKSGRHQIRLFSEKTPEHFPWKAWNVDAVLDCTGAYTEREKAQIHRTAGAQKVLLSAPGKKPDLTLCWGVSSEHYQPDQHHLLSNASCTTNCLAPLVRVLDHFFGVDWGTFLTVHSYTNDQALLDGKHKDLRRSRAAALSQIPTSTGAASNLGILFPHLNGKMSGLAIRVPTPNVSFVELTCQLQQSPETVEDLNHAFQRASQEGPLRGLLQYETSPLVSSDFNGSLASAHFDSLLTQKVGPSVWKVFAWYDNECGFSARMLDVASHLFSGWKGPVELPALSQAGGLS